MDKKSIGVIGLKGLPAFGSAATVGENIIAHKIDEYDFTVYSSFSHTIQKLESIMVCIKLFSKSYLSRK